MGDKAGDGTSFDRRWSSAQTPNPRRRRTGWSRCWLRWGWWYRLRRQWRLWRAGVPPYPRGTRRQKAKLPRSRALASLAREVRTNPKVVGVLVGIAKPKAAKRKSYCEAVCDCCADGGWMAPWCCISCASCDVFEVDLQLKLAAL